MKKHCPTCGKIYDWYVAECPVCHVLLEDEAVEVDDVDEADEDAADDLVQASPDAKFVVAFETTDPGVLPLAEIALEQAGIEYTIQNGGISDIILGARAGRRLGENDRPIEVVVRAEDASRARECLDDLRTADAAIAPAVPSASTHVAGGTAASSGGTIHLVDAETGGPIGDITDTQFRFLAECLEAESLHDSDYYIDEPTLALLEDKHADPALIEMLRRALGSREGLDVRWVLPPEEPRER